MMPAANLPPDFADLAPYLHWALPTEVARSQLRRDSKLSDLTAFYQAMLPRLPAMLSHLNECPLDALPDAELNLFRISLSFAEVAPFVEQYNRTVIPLMFDERRFAPLHDSAEPPS
jgi:hypothetical protein